MGNESEFETRNGCKRETRRYKIHNFSTKNKKNREKTGKTGRKHKKKQEKYRKSQEKHRKLQEIQKQDFNEVPGNAENGNEFSARFWEMLQRKQEQKQGLLKCHETTI